MPLANSRVNELHDNTQVLHWSKGRASADTGHRGQPRGFKPHVGIVRALPFPRNSHRLILRRFHGGWLAPNIFFLGSAGCVRVNGLRIAGMSGIFNKHHYHQGTNKPTMLMRAHG